MCSARSKPIGLRTRLTLWSSLVLAASLAAGFGWVHYGLRRVLEARNDAFLERKAAELLASVSENRPGGMSELEAEIRREVLAYEPEGLVVVVSQPGPVSIAPRTAAARRLAAQPVPPGSPRTVGLADAGGQYRVLAASSRHGPPISRDGFMRKVQLAFQMTRSAPIFCNLGQNSVHDIIQLNKNMILLCSITFTRFANVPHFTARLHKSGEHLR
jgi:hypothetical protein